MGTVKKRGWQGVAGRALIVASAVIVTASMTVATAVAGGGGGGGGGKKPPLVHLVVHAWTVGGLDIFGYGGLVADYDRKHQDVTVEVVYDEGQPAHHDAIMGHLAANDAWADVVAVEMRTLNEIFTEPGDWADLNPYAPGAGSEYSPFRWSAARTLAGRQLGLPVDLPSVAMCYRRDLFAQAGLPSDRAAVAAAWPTWADFVAMGVQYKAQTGTAMIDSVRPAFEAITLQQGDPIFFDAGGNLVADTSPSIGTGWSLSVQMIQAGITANAPPWTGQWFAGMSDGSFAAMICPSWLLGAVQAQAPGLAGEWDIAPLPGGTASYWGGTWLSVPATSQHPAEAGALAAYLTDKQAGLTLTATGSANPDLGLVLPANLDALASPQIQNVTSGYFNGAPVGELFTAGAADGHTAYLGPRYGALIQVMTDALGTVESGVSTPQDAWAAAMAQVTSIGS